MLGSLCWYIWPLQDKADEDFVGWQGILAFIGRISVCKEEVTSEAHGVYMNQMAFFFFYYSKELCQ